MSGNVMGRSARFCVALLVAMGYAGALGCAPNGKFVPSSARAWIWVEPGQTRSFVAELRAFSYDHGLRINVSNPPSPAWTMTGIVIVTPKQNDIAIINDVDSNKYSAEITLSQPEGDWKLYWNALRAIVSSRHRWEDA